MNRLIVVLIVLLLPSTAALTGQSADPSAGPPALDYDFFVQHVESIFLVKRPGRVACVNCHVGRTRLRLEPLAEGATFWTPQQSRAQFEAASRLVVPGDPLASRLLTHPLARAAGGDPFHGGGRQFPSKDSPEWRMLEAWVRGERVGTRSNPKAVRIIQTNAAGDNTHVIDPATNRVVGVINDIRMPHGVVGAPDGSRIYITDESLHTLDVVDARSLDVARRIPLSGRPNNLAVSKDGRKIYAGIAQAPGALDVIDTVSLTNVKTIPLAGAIHNVYVTPDGRYAVAGSVVARTISVVDTVRDAVAWTLELDAGIRPMAFDTNPDGSTKHIYVQLSNFHGFAVVDFAARKEIRRVEHPPVPGVEAHRDGLQGAPAHGLGVSPDGRTLWSTSKVYGYAYVYSLPELEEIGRVAVGQHPEWITFTPDARYVYVAAAGDNMIYVIDVQRIAEVARIPVGQVPKRNATATLQTF